MATDVLLTGPGYDLDLRDTLTDVYTDRRLIPQVIETALATTRGEYVYDATYGVDILGYLTSKPANANALAHDIGRELGAQFPWLDVVSVRGSQVGREMTVYLDGIANREPIRVSLALAQGDPSIGGELVAASLGRVSTTFA